MNQKELKNSLNSGKSSLILDALRYISTNGNKEILNDVIELLHTKPDEIILNEIVNILENLKVQDCSKVIVDAITNPAYNEELSILVSSCWKNGLNFEDYIEVFTDIFIKCEFLVAFDAFTVIDTFNKIDQKKAELCIIKLENSIEAIKKDKIPLHRELINIIKNIKENPAD